MISKAQMLFDEKLFSELDAAIAVRAPFPDELVGMPDYGKPRLIEIKMDKSRSAKIFIKSIIRIKSVDVDSAFFEAGFCFVISRSKEAIIVRNRLPLVKEDLQSREYDNVFKSVRKWLFPYKTHQRSPSRGFAKASARR